MPTNIRMSNSSEAFKSRYKTQLFINRYGEELVSQTKANKMKSRRKKLKYPCIICNKEVNDQCNAISCDTCNKWIHVKCTALMTWTRYKKLVKSGENFNYICDICRSINQAYRQVRGHVEGNLK